MSFGEARHVQILTVIRSIHLIAQRKPVIAIELGAIRWQVEHWHVKQVGEVATNESLICPIWVWGFDLDLMKHILENFN